MWSDHREGKLFTTPGLPARSGFFYWREFRLLMLALQQLHVEHLNVVLSRCMVAGARNGDWWNCNKVNLAQISIRFTLTRTGTCHNANVSHMWLLRSTTWEGWASSSGLPNNFPKGWVWPGDTSLSNVVQINSTMSRPASSKPKNERIMQTRIDFPLWSFRLFLMGYSLIFFLPSSVWEKVFLYGQLYRKGCQLNWVNLWQNLRCSCPPG